MTEGTAVTQAAKVTPAPECGQPCEELHGEARGPMQGSVPAV